jgi:hypothetical protein
MENVVRILRADILFFSRANGIKTNNNWRVHSLRKIEALCVREKAAKMRKTSCLNDDEKLS